MLHLLDYIYVQHILLLTLTTGASTGSVAVTVTDYNDETPEFIPSSLSASVAEEARFGTTVATLRVRNYRLHNVVLIFDSI